MATAETLQERLGFVKYGKGRADHHARLPEEGYDGWRVITTIRNPCDAAVSLWHHWNRPVPFGRAFVDWCYERYPNLFPIPARWFGLHVDRATHVLRLERLDVDLGRALLAAGLDPVSVPRKHVGVRRQRVPYQLFFDKQTITWWRDYFGEEMRALGYDYEKLR